MHPDTARALNALNADFYRTTAPEFDQTRGQAWAGWQAIVPYAHAIGRTPLRVLDVGCGNGRWGVFLAEQGLSVDYHGVDNSTALLSYAHDALSRVGVPFRLQEADALLSDDWAQAGATYDLIGAFGVLHHVPSSARRLALARFWASLLAQGGVLAFATWRFYDNKRLRGRVVGWSALPDLPHADTLEAGDYLLDWRRGERALRYCHHTDDDEHRAIEAATELVPCAFYRADGQDGQLNAYSILRKGV